MVGDLFAPLPRAALVLPVQTVLGVTRQQAEQIVQAFDDFVAAPLEANLKKRSGRDLAMRNPMIYTARGTTSAEDWVNRVLDDKETSAIEAHLGTWQEEVARIVSGGIKPGSGVDLQVTNDDGVIDLYAIQASTNTKNSASRNGDVVSLKRAARPLRAHRQVVRMSIAVLNGRAKAGSVRAEPEIAMLASDEFWERVSGIADFRARLLKASMILAALVKARAAEEVTRIRDEAMTLFSDSDGGLNLDALANPPKKARSKERLVRTELET